MSCLVAVGHPKPHSIRIVITGTVFDAKERQSMIEDIRAFADKHDLKMKEVRAAEAAKKKKRSSK